MSQSKTKSSFYSYTVRLKTEILRVDPSDNLNQIKTYYLSIPVILTPPHKENPLYPPEILII